MSAVENLPMQTEAVELVAAIKTPLKLTANMDKVRAYFIEQLKQYDLVVTADTLADAKKLAAELNKAATDVKAKGKAVSSEALAPIEEFNTEVKGLAQLLLDARTKLVEQVKRFEDETRAKALEVLQAYLVEQGTAKGIQPEFQSAKVDDLANLSTLTSTGKLSAKAKAEVDNRIQADLNLQQQTEMRLLKLENESYKAGMAVALERRHVEAFLFADEREYSMRLASLLEAEVLREAKAREAADERALRESKLKAEAEQRAAEAEAARKSAEQDRIAQREKHEAEMKLQAQQFAKEVEQAQRAPQPAVEPISMGEQAIKHAIGALDNPKDAPKHIVTFSEACRIAAATPDCDRVGIWTKGSGIYPEAIILRGQAVKAYFGA
jgi:hypothetical protein